MKNLKIPQITDAELSVMKVLWNKGACTSNIIVEEVSAKHQWNDKTIRTLINRLVSKKAISADKSDTKSYIYSAKVSRQEYENQESKNYINKLYNGSVKLMLTSFVKNNNLTKEDIEDLKKILSGEDK